MHQPTAQTESPYEIVRRMENMLRVGTVVQVRHGHPARCRIKTGDLTTTWIPWVAARAGGKGRRQWWPPVVGEQAMVMAPGGDLTNAVALPGIYSDAKPQGSDSATTARLDLSDTESASHDSATGTLSITIEQNISVRLADGTSVQMQPGRITLSAGGGWLTVDGSGVTAGPDVRAGGISLIGHRHSDVRSGTSNTGGPL